MEINGIKVDKKYLSNLSMKFSQRIEKLEKKITKQTKAIMLVHALGNCTNMSLLMKIVKKYREKYD